MESLTLCIPNGISAAAISTLLKVDTLKKLKVIYCSNALNFDDLARNLLKQMPNWMLDELKVEGKGTYDVTNEKFTCTPYFCDTMFGMPQLEHLFLEITLSYFHKFPEIIETMYASWKRNSKGRKPKQLSFRFLHPPPNLEERQEAMKSEMGVTTVIKL